MEHIRETGLYDIESDIWRFYTVEEAEKHETTCSNWPKVLEDLKKYLGKTWLDKHDIRYSVNNVPVYKEYTIVGIEDNQAWGDYYWILKDKDGKTKFGLANDADFYKWII